MFLSRCARALSFEIFFVAGLVCLAHGGHPRPGMPFFLSLADCLCLGEHLRLGYRVHVLFLHVRFLVLASVSQSVCLVSTLRASSPSSSLPPPQARTHARTHAGALTERESEWTCAPLHLSMCAVASFMFVRLSIYALLHLRSAAARPSPLKWCTKGLSLG